MILPNFLIIGAMKAGTTSLHYYLAQHPEIFLLPQKETNFFAQESAMCMREKTVTEEQEYASLFRDVTNEKAIGETSPAYLCVIDAPRRIAKMLPNAKLIAVLRNPIERAFSHYVMRRQQGKEVRASFDEVMATDDIDPLRSYKSRGFYGQQITRYLKHFPKEQIQIFLYEELVENPIAVVRGICQFLEIDQQFVPNMSKRHNVNPHTDEAISPESREKLRSLYQEDMLLLQELIEKDVSKWLQ